MSCHGWCGRREFCAGSWALSFLDWTCESNFLGAGLLITVELMSYNSCLSVLIQKCSF